MRITVCIATCNRNQGLTQALSGVARLAPPGGAEIDILVIDNSAEANAEATVAECGSGFPWPLSYVHEPRRGICSARNAALDNTAGADFIAFIDDDEIPEPDWLEQLVLVQRRFDADVIHGPVLARFETPPPHWTVAGGFFNPQRHPDGAAITVAYTGNVMFRRKTVSDHRLRFDERLNQIGGEDLEFFDRWRRLGARMHFADHAIVFETVPPSRANLKWLLRRWFRTGNSEAILYMTRNRGWAARCIVAGRGALRLGLGIPALALASLAAVLAPHWPIARLYTVARGLGMLSSACNLHYHEYAQG